MLEVGREYTKKQGYAHYGRLIDGLMSEFRKTNGNIALESGADLFSS